MKIPNNIKIGWRDYTVEFIEERIDEDEELLDGEIDFSNHIIYINNDLLNEDEKIVTFLHEIIHGVFQSQGHSEWGSNEDLIEAVSEGLFLVMKDNPRVFSD